MVFFFFVFYPKTKWVEAVAWVTNKKVFHPWQGYLGYGTKNPEMYW
jgi:hypothetical protein